MIKYRQYGEQNQKRGTRWLLVTGYSEKKEYWYMIPVCAIIADSAEDAALTGH